MRTLLLSVLNTKGPENCFISAGLLVLAYLSRTYLAMAFGEKFLRIRDILSFDFKRSPSIFVIINHRKF